MKRLTALLSILLATHCLALEDTPENRATEAARYLAVAPPEEMMNDMAQNIAKTMPEDQRTAFLKMMTESLDMAALKEAILKSSAKIFTADELKALADFYSTPEGKSSMKKMGPYMADLMPVIQAQIMQAMKKARESSAPATTTP